MASSMPNSAIIAEEEDGSKLWLRYARVGDKTLFESYRHSIGQIIIADSTPAMRRATEELKLALPKLVDRDVVVEKQVQRAGALVVGTPASLPVIAALGWDRELTDLGPEGHVIRSIAIDGHPSIVIA